MTLISKGYQWQVFIETTQTGVGVSHQRTVNVNVFNACVLNATIRIAVFVTWCESSTQ